jgi:hypothetical protein
MHQALKIRKGRKREPQFFLVCFFSISSSSSSSFFFFFKGATTRIGP